MELEMSHHVDTATCPLCGGPNDCAMARDPNANECWCGGLEFPQELLDQVPENAHRKTCICRHCHEKFMNESKGRS